MPHYVPAIQSKFSILYDPGLNLSYASNNAYGKIRLRVSRG